MIYDALNQSPTGLRSTGIAVGTWLLASHVFALWQADRVMAWLKAFPFNKPAGIGLIALAGIWSLALFQGLDLGPLEIPRMDMGEFYTLRPKLMLLVPVATVLVALYCQEFLAVRALGCVLLLAAAIPLDAAFLKEPASRLLLVALAYGALTLSLFWIGMPYLLRDQANWATASKTRWSALCAAGIVYGAAILACALAWW